MTTKDLILQELEQVSESILQAVLDFLRLLKPRPVQLASEHSVMEFAGILSDAEAEAIQVVVNQEFEQVDLNEW